MYFSINGDLNDLCSYVNDSQKNYNSIMKPILQRKSRRIGLFASRLIKEKEEITYSYTDGYNNMLWRKQLPLLYQHLFILSSNFSLITFFPDKFFFILMY